MDNADAARTVKLVVFNVRGLVTSRALERTSAAVRLRYS